MNNEFIAVNLKSGDADNGFIRCGECDAFLANINYETCRNLYMQFKCRCGADSYLIIGNKDFAARKDFSTVGMSNNIAVCGKCGNRLFGICGGTDAFAFAVECSCGEKYNTRYEIKRNFSDERGLHNINGKIE